MKAASARATLAVLTLVGCHEPFSNEDLLFLYESVPPDIAIAVPTEDGSTGIHSPGRPPPPGTAVFYGDARRSADAVNKDVLALVAWVDAIVMQPPSQRLEDQRVWGPIPGNNGVAYTLVTSRVRTSTVFRATSTSTAVVTDALFDFAMFATSSRAPAGRTIFQGRQVSDSNGGTQGIMLVDLDGNRAVDPTETGQGQVLVSYDTRFDQLTVELGLGALYFGEPLTAAWRHTQESSGAGTFLFFLRQDVDLSTSELELWFVVARWRSDGQGRADVSITGGDLRLPLFAQECWDTDFRRTYILSNIPDEAYLPQGSLQDCAADLRDSAL